MLDYRRPPLSAPSVVTPRHVANMPVEGITVAAIRRAEKSHRVTDNIMAATLAEILRKHGLPTGMTEAKSALSDYHAAVGEQLLSGNAVCMGHLFTIVPKQRKRSVFRHPRKGGELRAKPRMVLRIRMSQTFKESAAKHAEKIS